MSHWRPIHAVLAVSVLLTAAYCLLVSHADAEPKTSSQSSPTSLPAYIPPQPLPACLQKIAGFSDDDIDQAIKKACGYLWSRRHSDGKWDLFSAGDKVYAVGPTAAACYALMLAEGAAKDERMAKTLDWLAAQKTSKTVELMFLSAVWLETVRTNNRKYIKQQEANMEMLLRKDFKDGYPADVLDPSCPNDSTNAFFALLAMWEASKSKLDVPPSVWTEAANYWTLLQNTDYGWGSVRSDGKSTPTMTASGIAASLMCLDTLVSGKAGSYARRDSLRPVQMGLSWMDAKFAGSLSDSPDYHYLFALERAGTMSGTRHIGGLDWYKAAAGQLLANQQSDGSWKFDDASQGSPEIATAMAIIFLSRSRQPVLFLKIQTGDDWNNRPRDLAIFCQWLGKLYERTINWQTINIKYPLSEWGEAPIAFLSGAKPPVFDDEDIAKLREFVLRGGVIFSCSTYDSKEFKEAMRQAYQKMFPGIQLVPQAANDQIYTIRETVDPSSSAPLSSRVNFSIATNGIRPFAIHCDTDLPKSWQQGVGPNDRFAFEAGANLFLYATAKGSLFNRRSSACLWPEMPTQPPEKTIEVSHLIYKGNYNPEPLAFERFARLMLKQTGIYPKIVDNVEIKNIAKAQTKIAIITGTESIGFTAEQKNAIKQFTDKGGVIIIDAAGGSSSFADSMEKMIEEVYGKDALIKATPFDAIYHVPNYPINKFSYRPTTLARLGGKADPQLMTAYAAANRVGIVFSHEDITSGLLGYPSASIDGYSPTSAYEIMRNLLLQFGKVKEQPAPSPTPNPSEKK